MRFVSIIKVYLVALWHSLTSAKNTGKDVIEAARLYFLANQYSRNTKRMLSDQTAALQVADSILELSVGAILVGTIELYGIQMIVNATGLTGTVNTMFTSVLVILIVIADVYIFMGAAKRLKGRGG